MDLMHINTRLFLTLKWKLSVKQTSVFTFLLKLLLKKKNAGDLNDWSLQIKQMIMFFFTYEIIWIRKTSTKFKIVICGRWIMLSRPHFAHMPRVPVSFHRGVCFCVRPATGRWPRWPPPRWAVKLGEDVLEPDVKRRTQQRRFREEIAKNGKRKRKASSRAASQNESEESKKWRECGRVWILSQWGFHGNLPTSSFFFKKKKTALQTEGQQLVRIKIAKQALVCLNFPLHHAWSDVTTTAAVMIAPRRTRVFTGGAVKNSQMIRMFIKTKNKKQTNVFV